MFVWQSVCNAPGQHTNSLMIYPKKISQIWAYLGVHQVNSKIRPKYKGNGHNYGDKFVSAITFYQMQILRNRFRCWSPILLYFETTPIMTIFMAILHNHNYWKMTIMVVMARLDMAINMVFMGVISKYSKIADEQRKRFLKFAFGKTLWPKQICHHNYSNFLCILALFLSSLGGPLNMLWFGWFFVWYISWYTIME